MTDLDKAREWADRIRNTSVNGYPTNADCYSAAEVIQSLPDQWVDVEKVREAISGQLSVYTRGTVSHYIAEEITRNLEALITPKLTTLAELIEAGNDPKRYEWMQCKIEDTDRMGVITGYDEVGEFEYCTSVTFRDEADTWFDPSLVIPLPELPKLEWPGGVVDCEIVEESAPTDPDPIHTPMQPSEVPANEPWLIEANGQKAVGTRYEGNSVVPWSVAALDGSFAGDYNDSEVTLIHKLVPEPPALPEGMRLADHKEYGRVVVSPKVDDGGDLLILALDEDDSSGAYSEYCKSSELTFLDGDQHV